MTREKVKPLGPPLTGPFKSSSNLLGIVFSTAKLLAQLFLNVSIFLVFFFSSGSLFAILFVAGFLILHFLVQVFIQFAQKRLYPKSQNKTHGTFYFLTNFYWVLTTSGISGVFWLIELDEEKTAFIDNKLNLLFPLPCILVQIFLNRLNSHLISSVIIGIFEGMISIVLFAANLFFSLPSEAPRLEIFVLIFLHLLINFFVVSLLIKMPQEPFDKKTSLLLHTHTQEPLEKRILFESECKEQGLLFEEVKSDLERKKKETLLDMEEKKMMVFNDNDLSEIVVQKEQIRSSNQKQKFQSEIFPKKSGETSDVLELNKTNINSGPGIPLLPLDDIDSCQENIVSDSPIGKFRFDRKELSKLSINKRIFHSDFEPSDSDYSLTQQGMGSPKIHPLTSNIRGLIQGKGSGNLNSHLDQKFKNFQAQTAENLLSDSFKLRNQYSQNKLEKKKEKIRIVKALLEALPDGVAIITSSLELNLFNKSLFRIFNSLNKNTIKNKLLNLVCEPDPNLKNVEFMQRGSRMVSFEGKTEKEKASNDKKSDSLYSHSVRHNSLEIKNFGNTLKDRVVKIWEYFDETSCMKKKNIKRSITSKRYKKNSNKRLEKKQSYTFRSNYHENPNDPVIHLEIQLTPMIYSKEPMIGLMVRDVTQEKTIARLSAELESKTRVLANVSHELRTPLHGIMNFLSMAKESLLGLEAQKKENKKIVRELIEPAVLNTQRLSYLVGSYLDLSQLRAGKKDILNMTTFPLKECLRDCLKLVDLQAKEKNIELYLRYDSSLPLKITSDKNRLSQIVINLLGNAMKFTYKGSVTIIATNSQSLTQKNIRISVKDTGRGIKKEDQKKLFKEFGKIDYGDNAHGIGLGLMISNHLVMLLGKSNQGLKIKSEWNVGTEFFFEIRNNSPSSEFVSHEENIVDQAEAFCEFDARPAKMIGNLSHITTINNKFNADVTSLQQLPKDEKKYPYANLSTKDRKCGKCPRVLYVDDDPLNIMAFRLQASKMNLVFQTASSKEEGVQKLAERMSQRCVLCLSEEFSLILMDVELDRGQSGLDFATEIKNGVYSRGKPPAVKIVACSGHSKKTLSTKRGFSSVDGILEKPFTFEDLKNKLQSFDIDLGNAEGKNRL